MANRIQIMGYYNETLIMLCLEYCEASSEGDACEHVAAYYEHYRLVATHG